MRFDQRLRCLALVSALLPMAIGVLAADEDWLTNPQVVVELFTSQGCSSCPPADRLILDMVGCEQILPLGFHVDYWDYLGWKDAFASASFTARQRAYARSFRETMVYTPQIVVQGKTYMVGSRARDVRQAIRAVGTRLPDQGIGLDLGTMRISGDGIRNTLALTLVTFDPELQHVAIGAGENRNRTIAYANVVTGLRQFNLGPVRNGALAVPTEVPDLLADTDESVAILIHDRRNMQIQTALVRHQPTAGGQSCQNNLEIF